MSDEEFKHLVIESLKIKDENSSKRKKLYKVKTISKIEANESYIEDVINSVAEDGWILNSISLKESYFESFFIIIFEKDCQR